MIKLIFDFEMQAELGYLIIKSSLLVTKLSYKIYIETPNACT